MSEKRASVQEITWRVGVLAALAFVGVYAYSATQSDRQMAEPISIAMDRNVQAPDPKLGPMIEDIWQPATTPAGGVSWATLEATGETTRTDNEGYIVSKPLFTPEVEALKGDRIKVAGWMMPLETGTTQDRFVLLGYPPGCPFHFHAAPNQFIEVIASTPFDTNEVDSLVVSGVLELTGYDESGIFYQLKDARPG